MRNIKFCAWFLSLIILCGFSAYADIPQEEAFFRQGLEDFLKGNYEGAIGNFEQGYGISPGNDKIKEFLVKALAEHGSALYLQKNYKESLKFLKRAGEISPRNKRIQEMIDLVSQIIMPAQEAPPSPAPILTEILKKFQEENMKSMEKMMEKINVKEYIQKVDKEKLELMSLLENERKSALETQKELIRGFYKTGAVILVLSMTVLSVLFFAIFHFLSVRRESKTIFHQEKIWQMLQRSFPNGGPNSYKVDLEIKPHQRDIITDIDPRIRERARHIEAIEKELESETEHQIAISMLSPFLHDSNSRIRANAAKAMHRHSEQIAMRVLSEMALLDKWMRLSAAWALGEVGEDEACPILIKLAEDRENSVLRRALESLNKIVLDSSRKISSKNRGEIIKKLSEHNIELEIN